jgi:hypothetical protein
MKGILGKPYLDADNYVNADFLNSIRFKIYKGIAKSKPYVSEYFNSEFEFLDPIDLQHIINYVKAPLVPLYPKNNEIMALDDASECKNIYVNLDDEEKRIFLKLMGGSQPFSTLVLLEKGEWTQHSALFPEVVEWSKQLPFDNIKKIVFYIVESMNPTVIHADKHLHDNKFHKSEFLWFKITPEKTFFMYDEKTNTKINVTSTSCFFNERDYHGADAINHLAVSMKIWGTFSDEFRLKTGLSGEY